MGYSENDLIGRSSINFVHPEDVKKSMKALRNVTKGGIGKEGMDVIRIRDKKNIYHWFEIRGRTFIGRDNKLKALLVARDVTDWIIADQKLKKSEELYRKAYDRANIYKDLFTHDISNILQIIQSSVELSFIYIDEPQKINDIKRLRELIIDQVSRGKKLVSNVRKLSQIEQTQFPLQSTEICLVLNEAIEYIQKSIQTKKINIQIDSPFKTILVSANELLLDVFENILINATKYNENPIIEILIKISKIKIDSAQFLKIEFMDNGIGISDAKKKIVFHSGFKKEKQSKGMGLGLSLVKKIIYSYKGQIWVEDKIKGDFTKGSNFIVLIPEE